MFLSLLLVGDSEDSVNRPVVVNWLATVHMYTLKLKTFYQFLRASR